MPPPGGLGGGFSDDNPMIAPFSDGHPQIGRRLTGKRQALEALGVYHLVADARVPGQLASEKERRTQRILKVRSRLIADRLDRNALMKLIVRHEKDGSRQRELFIAIVWALAVTGPHRNCRGKDRGRANPSGPASASSGAVP
jgi:hypothetical protein